MVNHPAVRIIVVSLFLLAGCAGSHPPLPDFQYREKGRLQQLQKNIPSYPETRFIVLSDPHYFHPGLGTKGPAFQAYIDADRKLLAESDAILEAAIGQTRREKADFVLVCGDMTKDGERINHERVSEKIRRLHPEAPVYVIPGNHDVLSGDAYRYTAEGKERIPTVTAAEFRDIYAPFGYDQALAEDPASLSYVVEPVPGLWLLGLDSCLWRENDLDSHPHVNGRFSPDTLRWLENMLIRARRENKAVMAFMHHGLMEHYPANEKYYSEYIVDNSETVSELLASYGVRLVFTGHFHAQDITVKKKWNEEQAAAPERFVFDVETGSLVTYPCPYRLVSIAADQSCTIESRFIESIAGMGADFTDYARRFAYQGTIKLADDTLAEYKVSKKARQKLSPQIADAYLAHLAGDEKKPEVMISGRGSGIMGRIVLFFQRDLVEGWWTDLPPPDNQLVIDLEDGTWHQ